MPKGKESLNRQRKNYNKIDLNMASLKSTIKKMAEYASSSLSGTDSFRDGNEIATIPPTTEKMDITETEPTSTVKLPSFKKKVRIFIKLKWLHKFKKTRLFLILIKNLRLKIVG